ncbi:hypothetical protein PG994_015064 [Apiospora phragmitis]|uniref:FAD-binding PCMH-type domain-containing protein n=1 Tax=Apiospora phragmitis TaxID=2905665 RepID=A0ABR1SVE3_9PEZI
MPLSSSSTSISARSARRQPWSIGILQRDHILRNIREHIDDVEYKHDVDPEPLKRDVIEPILRNEFDPQVQIRGIMHALRHTLAFRSALQNIKQPGLREQVEAFLRGKAAEEVVAEKGFSLPCSHSIHHPAAAKTVQPLAVKRSFLDVLKDMLLKILNVKSLVTSCLRDKARPHKLPQIWEDEAKSKEVKVYPQDEFENWGQTVKNTPQYTFLPTTVLGVQNLVRWCAPNNLHVRCAGYRHSWSPIFSQDNEVLVSFVDLTQVTSLPDPMSIQPGNFTGMVGPDISELKTIEFKENLGPKKQLCRIGAGVTNEEFRRWALKNKTWALPVDVILVEVTIGGVNGPICHGAGREHQTCSDLVRRIEYVDCHGELQTVDDKELIKAAAGCFGLLGVVTHITFELDAMSYAVLQPRKVDIGLAIPPVEKEDIPEELRADWFGAADADAQLQAANAEFERRADDYYSEWFWFPYQQKAWVNTWKTVEKEKVDKGVKIWPEYPDPAGVFMQWIQGWLGHILTSSTLFGKIPGAWQAQLLATNGMANLAPIRGEDDEEPTIVTPLPNALHFQRGIQNMRVRDIEFQIPIPARADDASRPDFTVVRRAWWDAIKLVYDYGRDGKAPMRVTLELRIMGGSDVLMAPQHGNGPWGTASIEVLTIPDADRDGEWAPYVQRMSDIWMAYTDSHGAKLNVRPHWAKEWDGFQLGGMDARKYFKTVAYKDQIPKFRSALAEIGKGQGWTLEELKNRFSNKLWDELVFEE